MLSTLIAAMEIMEVVYTNGFKTDNGVGSEEHTRMQEVEVINSGKSREHLYTAT